MLWMVTGGVGSGKSAFARRWAAAHGREAILLTCPPWPAGSGEAREIPDDENEDENEYGKKARWMRIAADRALAEKLNKINLQSNPFRASARVVVLDGLSGWLRAEIAAVRGAGLAPGGRGSPASLRRGRLLGREEAEARFARAATALETRLSDALAALRDFDGIRVVVTEEPAAGLATDPWERWYASRLAYANRTLAEASDGMHRLTAGLATEIKGQRMKRGTSHHENLYPNRR